MTLTKNNEAFDKFFDFPGGVELKQVTRVSDNGAITSVELVDRAGNVLRFMRSPYGDGIDFYTKKQVTRYKLHGTVDGCRIEQLFDDKHEAEARKEKFNRITITDHDATVDLQVEEVLVADN